VRELAEDDDDDRQHKPRDRNRPLVPGPLGEQGGHRGGEDAGRRQDDQVRPQPVIRLLQQRFQHFRRFLALLRPVLDPVAVDGQHRHFRAG
jgi:hypothetical protein